MADPLPQHSQIVFPVALDAGSAETENIAHWSDPWGWLELFVLSQVFWGVLLFVPGSQAFRIYVRAFPYVVSLVALVSCARSSGTDTAVPGARWIIAAMLLLVANLVHDETWFMAGVAMQMIYYHWPLI